MMAKSSRRKAEFCSHSSGLLHAPCSEFGTKKIQRRMDVTRSRDLRIPKPQDGRQPPAHASPASPCGLDLFGRSPDLLQQCQGLTRRPRKIRSRMPNQRQPTPTHHYKSLQRSETTDCKANTKSNQSWPPPDKVAGVRPQQLKMSSCWQSFEL